MENIFLDDIVVFKKNSKGIRMRVIAIDNRFDKASDKDNESVITVKLYFKSLKKFGIVKVFFTDILLYKKATNS